MIETERSCLDVAQQLQAAERAVHEAKKTFINDHLDHCLGRAVADTRPKSGVQMAEFKAITKYL